MKTFNLFLVLLLLSVNCFAADVDKALVVVFGHEGGLQCDKNDPGNWTGGKVGKGKQGCTKFGIATNTFPKEDIKHLTLERASKLYYDNFWKPLNLDLMKSQGLATEIFDTAVNCGEGTSAKMPNQAVVDVQQIVEGLEKYTPKNATTLSKDTVEWINKFTETDYYTSESETNITKEEYQQCLKDGFIVIPVVKDEVMTMNKETCIEDRSNRVMFWLMLNRLQSKRYTQIVLKNPKMLKYYVGWEKRTLD